MIDADREAIHDALASTDPLSLRKAQLLEMRRRVLEIVTAEPKTLPPVVFSETGSRKLEAIGLVRGYEGSNRFMLSLKQSLASYGNLTPRQVDAVLAPPSDTIADELEAVGVDLTTVTFQWQGYDALSEAQKRARTA